MKKILAIVLFMSIVSCNKSQNEASEEYFDDIKNKISAKFGKSSYYTGLMINETAQGTILSVLHIGKQSQLKASCYVYTNGLWKEMYSQPLSILPNEKSGQYMFQLDEKIDSYTLAKIVSDAKKDVRDRIQVNDLKLEQLAMRPPKSGNLPTIHYDVTIRSDSLERNFNYRYNIDGTLYDADLNNTE